MAKFFDPHPGIGGPSVSLPLEIKAIIDAYADKKAEIADLLVDLGKITGATCWADLEHRYISCRIINDGYTHQWRLIQWTDT